MELWNEIGKASVFISFLFEMVQLHGMSNIKCNLLEKYTFHHHRHRHHNLLSYVPVDDDELGMNDSKER